VKHRDNFTFYLLKAAKQSTQILYATQLKADPSMVTSRGERGQIPLPPNAWKECKLKKKK
jgi:hypothetical protein